MLLLAALFGFALENGAGFARVYVLAPVERGQAPAKLYVELAQFGRRVPARVLPTGRGLPAPFGGGIVAARQGPRY